MKDFLTTFNVCYELMYNDVVPENSHNVDSFDYLLKMDDTNEDKQFYFQFCNARKDICTSDREAAAFDMAFRRYGNDYSFNS